jgi:hypothetical protein
MYFKEQKQVSSESLSERRSILSCELKLEVSPMGTWIVCRDSLGIMGPKRKKQGFTDQNVEVWGGFTTGSTSLFNCFEKGQLS